MKKVISLVAVCLLLIGMIGFSASAATPKEEVIAAAKAALPAEYQSKYLPAIENVLSQVEVTAEQAESLIANIETAKAAIKEDKGSSLSEYTAEEAEAVLAEFDEACTTLGLEYEFVDAENPAHEGDQVVKIQKADGSAIGTVDGEGVKKTNAPESNVALMIALAGAVVLAAGAAAYGKKLAAR